MNKEIRLPNGFTFDMIFIKGGKFIMGNERDTSPIHEVSVPDYFLGKYLVTQGLWKVVMGEKNNPSFFQGDLRPVESVSWNNAKTFIQKLNEKTGKTYRLPTEAEWEFAARGGIYSQRYLYAGSDKLKEVGWYNQNSERTTYSVGQKLPNELGIYDLSGNVWEWCEDDWHKNYKGIPTNGSAWINKKRGGARILRGGSWGNASEFCDVSYRSLNLPDYPGSQIGFRLAL